MRLISRSARSCERHKKTQLIVFRGVSDQHGAPCRPVSDSFHQFEAEYMKMIREHLSSFFEADYIENVQRASFCCC